MPTFTTVDLNNLNPNREIFRMSGNRFMEVLWQGANTTEPEYGMLRVVDMGNPGGTATAVSSTYILPKTMPFNVQDFVIRSGGINASGNPVSSTTSGSSDSRGYYGASVPMSSTELLITHGTKMYRFTYDEGVTNEIIFDGEVTIVGGTLPDCVRFQDVYDSGSTQYHTVETGLYRMGTSNSFILNKQPRLTEYTPSTSDESVFQIWEYNSAAKTITQKFNIVKTYSDQEACAMLREIPGSNDVFVGKTNYTNYKSLADLSTVVSITNSYVYSPDGTFVALDSIYDSLGSRMPLPLTSTQVWWVRNNNAVFVDYNDLTNNKTINFTSGNLPFEEPGAQSSSQDAYPNDGWAVSDTEFVAARNYNNGYMDLIAVKDTGFGFGDFSPNGKQSLGTLVGYNFRLNVSETIADQRESEYTEFFNINGSGEFGNALYRIDADTYQYECVAVKAVSGSPGTSDAKLYQYRIKRA